MGSLSSQASLIDLLLREFSSTRAFFRGYSHWLQVKGSVGMASTALAKSMRLVGRNLRRLSSSFVLGLALLVFLAALSSRRLNYFYR